ncbi:MAG: OadG family transporter subunit [Kiritimatiellia bacterium]
MLQQGLVLLIAGMGIAISFLLFLAIVMVGLGKIIPYINVLPDPTRKVPQKPAVAASEDESVAVAIAIAQFRK